MIECLGIGFFLCVMFSKCIDDFGIVVMFVIFGVYYCYSGKKWFVECVVVIELVW